MLYCIKYIYRYICNGKTDDEFIFRSYVRFIAELYIYNTFQFDVLKKRIQLMLHMKKEKCSAVDSFPNGDTMLGLFCDLKSSDRGKFGQVRITFSLSNYYTHKI